MYTFRLWVPVVTLAWLSSVSVATVSFAQGRG